MAELELRRQTYVAHANDVPCKYRHLDATGIPLGRLAAEVAIVLMGKHRPEYTPNAITGDRVIITNGSKVLMTGKKAEQKLKLRYTRYPGGLKAETYGQIRERRPELLIQDAVRRMLPKNRISRVMLKNLEVFSGTDHPYAAHKPEALKVRK
jgi:large subunit ribosomal protein L13